MRRGSKQDITRVAVILAIVVMVIITIVATVDYVTRRDALSPQNIVTHGQTCDDTCDDTGTNVDAHDNANVGDRALTASFTEVTTSDFISMLDAGDTFVAVFGFTSCPACQHAMPILTSVARQHNWTVCWIDTRANPDWKSNTDIDDYDELCRRVGSYFPTDDNGRPHMDAPSVFFVKDGKVVAFHNGTLDTLDDENAELTDEQRQELAEIYENGFESVERD